MLALTFGSTTGAAAAVIGSFMAGMGFGARGYERLHRRFGNAFGLYSGIELGIAGSTAFVTVSLYALPEVYAAVTGVLPDGAALTAFRFGSVFAILLVPAALMGATYPALCAALINSSSGLRRHLGPIYGLNTLGAAIGALIAGFILIEMVGSRAAVYIANGGNVLCAAGAIYLARLARRTMPEKTTPAADSAGPFPVSVATTPALLPAWVIALVLVGSGFATMAYEIFWFRAIKYIVGNSTYAMSLVLTIFLAGLGLGGLLHRRLTRRPFPEIDMGWTQLGIAFMATAAMGLVTWVLSDTGLAENFSIFSRELLSRPWYESLSRTSLVSVAMLLPPTIFMGLAFPLGTAVYVQRIAQLDKRVGTAYLLANIGSITGVLAGVVILLPHFGIMGATKLVVLINIVLAVVVITALRRSAGRRRLAGFALGVISCLALTWLLPADLAFRGEFEQKTSSRLLYWEEDDISTVKVVDNPFSHARVMTIDGYVIGGNLAYGYGVAYKQFMLAHLPMLLHPTAARTLNIGLGSGSTMDALSAYPQIRSLECVEISPAVVEGARLFRAGAVLGDARTRVHIADAVHHLLTDTATYDLIIADGKQNPQFAGNAAILSREMYSYARERLAPHGMYVQWISMGLAPRAYEIILRTFIDVFPEVNVFEYSPMMTLMIGSNEPLRYPEMPGDSNFPISRAGTDFAPFDIDHPLQVLSGRVTGKAGLQKVLGSGEINSWDHPLLEFVPYREFNPGKTGLDQPYHNLALLLAAAAAETAAERPAVPPALAPYLASSQAIREGYLSLLATADPEALRPACLKAMELNPADSRPEKLLRRIAGGLNRLVIPGSAIPDTQADTALELDRYFSQLSD
jgi:spermidine synthase